MADRQDELDLNQRPLGYESPRGHVGTPLIVPRNAVDETFGVDVSKRLIDSLFGYLSLSYTFLGSPPRLGSARHVRLEPRRRLRGDPAPLRVRVPRCATAPAPGQEDPLELRVGAEFKLLNTLKLTGAVTRGFSKGSADWGVSAGLALRF